MGDSESLSDPGILTGHRGAKSEEAEDLESYNSVTLPENSMMKERNCMSHSDSNSSKVVRRRKYKKMDYRVSYLRNDVVIKTFMRGVLREIKSESKAKGNMSTRPNCSNFSNSFKAKIPETKLKKF